MMRFHATLTAGLAALAVLPAVARLDDGAPLDLERELAVTTRALAQLANLESRLREGDAASKSELLAATEPAILDPRKRDAALERLRREVGRLHESFDALAVTASGSAIPGPFVAPDPAAGGVVATSGLDPAQREALARRTGGEPIVLAPAAEARAPRVPQRYETQPGYSADALLQARLLLKIGRPEEAIPLLGRLEATPEVRYWLARSHERAGLLDEAERLYAALAAAGADGPDGAEDPFARRATVDLEFLRIKRDILETAPPPAEVRPR